MKTIRAPFGRVPETIARLTDNEKQRTAIKHGRRIGDDHVLQIWPHRNAMARLIRRQEQSWPQSEWRPLVALTDGEGYYTA